MDTLSAVKKQIQQTLAKQNAPEAQAKKRNLATAQVDRSKIPSHMFRGVPQPTSSSVGGLVKQELFQESTIASTSNVIRTSKVTFVGPPTDAEAKKKRACKLPLLTKSGIIMTCMPRSIHVRENLREK